MDVLKLWYRKSHKSQGEHECHCGNQLLSPPCWRVLEEDAEFPAAPGNVTVSASVTSHLPGNKVSVLPGYQTSWTDINRADAELLLAGFSVSGHVSCFARRQITSLSSGSFEGWRTEEECSLISEDVSLKLRHVVLWQMGRFKEEGLKSQSQPSYSSPAADRVLLSKAVTFRPAPVQLNSVMQPWNDQLIN